MIVQFILDHISLRCGEISLYQQVGPHPCGASQPLLVAPTRDLRMMPAEQHRGNLQATEFKWPREMRLFNALVLMRFLRH